MMRYAIYIIKILMRNNSSVSEGINVVTRENPNFFINFRIDNKTIDTICNFIFLIL